MKLQIMLSALVALAAAPAIANEQCFDKGSLAFVDCPQAGYDWTGLYIGAHVGYGGADLSGVFDSGAGPSALFFDELDETGFLVGGQIGFLQEIAGGAVFGVEVEASYVDIDDSVRVNPLDPEVGRFEVNYVASARGKLGYAFGRVMPFLTGGVGLVDFEAISDDLSGPAGVGVLEDTVVAPVAGGGLDFLIAENVIGGADFQYFFFDESLDLSGVMDGDPGDFVGVEDFWAARLKVSYKY